MKILNSSNLPKWDSTTTNKRNIFWAKQTDMETPRDFLEKLLAIKNMKEVTALQSYLWRDSQHESASNTIANSSLWNRKTPKIQEPEKHNCVRIQTRPVIQRKTDSNLSKNINTTPTKRQRKRIVRPVMTNLGTRSTKTRRENKLKTRVLLLREHMALKIKR